MSYRVRIYGREIVSSSYGLTNDEIDIIYDYMDDMGINDINIIGDSISDIIGSDLTNRDLWSVSKPLDYENKTTITVENSDGVEVLNFDISDIESIDDIYNDSNYFDCFPTDLNENILVTFEEKKGFIHDHRINSIDVPKKSDFTYTMSYISTPESEWDFVNELQYKGIGLNPIYDEKWVRRISYEIELHTREEF